MECNATLLIHFSVHLIEFLTIGVSQIQQILVSSSSFLVEVSAE